MGARHTFLLRLLPWLVGAALSLSAAACSCDSRGPRDTGGAPIDAPVPPGTDVPIPPGTDAPIMSMPDSPDARIDRTAFCMGMGPPVIVGDTTMSMATCAGSIATRVFDNSLCSCEDTNVVGYLRTRSFDSGVPGSTDDDYGAPVGVNGNYLTGGYADVGGSFVVSGTAGVTFGGYLRVRGDARFGGNVTAIGYIRAYRDFWVRGNIVLAGVVTADRDFISQPSSLVGAVTDVGGSSRRMTFTVDPPCHCDPSEIVDIAAIVAAGRMENDNADVGLDPNALNPVVGLGRDITLPCGRFYLTGISGLGDITLHVDGRTALFIDGDVNALGVFDITLGPGGELDMFIGGGLLSVGLGSYGDRSRPARTRIYVAGSGDVTIIGATGFVGNVYAPNARITAPGATTVYGSLFGRRIDMPGYLDVRYDRAILDVDVDCPPPPGGCEPCGGAGCTDHTACIGGMCTGCTSDADCCAPLVCYPGSGTCDSLVF